MPFIGEKCYKNINYLIKPLINNLKSHLADEKGIHYIYSLEKTRRECLTIPKKILVFTKSLRIIKFYLIQSYITMIVVI